MISPELQAKFTEWRAKATAKTLSLDEMKEAVRIMRESRYGAQAASDQARRKKARAEVKSADEMLDELGGL